MISAARAYEIASSWGSFTTNGDPGACFYGFEIADGRPQNEDHRKACIAYGEQCLKTAQGYVDRGEENVPGGDTVKDRDDLVELIAFFKGCTLVTQAATPELEAIRPSSQEVLDGASDFAKEAIRTLIFLGATPNEEDPVDNIYDFEPTTIAADDLRKIVEEADLWFAKAKPVIDLAVATGEVKLSADGNAYAHAAHDFMLTRNGHGAGFWDGDWPKAEGQVLTKLAKAAGELSLYEGDDGIMRIM